MKVAIDTPALLRFMIDMSMDHALLLIIVAAGLNILEWITALVLIDPHQGKDDEALDIEMMKRYGLLPMDFEE